MIELADHTWATSIWEAKDSMTHPHALSPAQHRPKTIRWGTRCKTNAILMTVLTHH